jgi:putative NADH-flavin reductase
MKKIALVGASGQTGSLFLEKALAAGYDIIALVRNPDKLTIPSHPNLTVLPGDVLNPEDVDQLVKGTSLVVSLFGHVKGSPEWLQSRGTENLVKAMRQHGVQRIISLSGGGLPFPKQDQPGLMDKLIRGIMKIAVPKILNDAIKHHQILVDSGVQWVIVRAPRLTNAPARGAYRIGWVGVNASTQISRGDLADFILTLVENESYDGSMPFVSW